MRGCVQPQDDRTQSNNMKRIQRGINEIKTYDHTPKSDGFASSTLSVNLLSDR